MKIGELAKATRLKAITIRYYESKGLLPPAERTAANYRAYNEADIERLEFIMKAKRLGLSLDDIKGVLLIHGRGEPTCVHVRELLDERLALVDSLLRDLQAFRKDLAMLKEQASGMEDCRPAGGRICWIIENSSFGAGRDTLTWIRSPGMKAE